MNPQQRWNAVYGAAVAHEMANHRRSFGSSTADPEHWDRFVEEAATAADLAAEAWRRNPPEIAPIDFPLNRLLLMAERCIAAVEGVFLTETEDSDGKQMERIIEIVRLYRHQRNGGQG
jgi:hypothetical protein